MRRRAPFWRHHPRPPAAGPRPRRRPPDLVRPAVSTVVLFCVSCLSSLLFSRCRHLHGTFTTCPVATPARRRVAAWRHGGVARVAPRAQPLDARAARQRHPRTRAGAGRGAGAGRAAWRGGGGVPRPGGWLRGAGPARRVAGGQRVGFPTRAGSLALGVHAGSETQPATQGGAQGRGGRPAASAREGGPQAGRQGEGHRRGEALPRPRVDVQHPSVLLLPHAGRARSVVAGSRACDAPGAARGVAGAGRPVGVGGEAGGQQCAGGAAGTGRVDVPVPRPAVAGLARAVCRGRAGRPPHGLQPLPDFGTNLWSRGLLRRGSGGGRRLLCAPGDKNPRTRGRGAVVHAVCACQRLPTARRGARGLGGRVL